MTNKYKHTSELLSEKVNPIIQIYFEYAQLKNIYRQGWLDKGVSDKHCESGADHSFMVALLGYTIALEYRPDLDPLKVMQLGLFHDLGEIYVGDLTPRDGVPNEKRKQMEFESVKKTFSKMPNPQKYVDRWLEYEKRELPEAKFVEQVDKVELALQALVYEKLGHHNLDEFYSYYRNRITSPELNTLMDEIISARPK